jgi:hypothetical protein
MKLGDRGLRHEEVGGKADNSLKKHEAAVGGGGGGSDVTSTSSGALSVLRLATPMQPAS